MFKFGSLTYISVRSRLIFFDLTDLDRPKAKPTRPRSFFDRNRPFSSSISSYLHSVAVLLRNYGDLIGLFFNLYLHTYHLSRRDTTLIILQKFREINYFHEKVSNHHTIHILEMTEIHSHAFLAKNS